MNTDDLTPPMFPMLPGFERLSRVGKIRIIHQGGETIGELIPYHLPQQKLFGARIDVLHAAVYHSRTEPPPIGEFITVGHIPVTTYKLPLNWLKEIEVSDDPNVPYTLKV